MQITEFQYAKNYFSIYYGLFMMFVKAFEN